MVDFEWLRTYTNSLCRSFPYSWYLVELLYPISPLASFGTARIRFLKHMLNHRHFLWNLALQGTTGLHIGPRYAQSQHRAERSNRRRPAGVYNTEQRWSINEACFSTMDRRISGKR